MILSTGILTNRYQIPVFFIISLKVQCTRLCLHWTNKGLLTNQNEPNGWWRLGLAALQQHNHFGANPHCETLCESIK